MRGNLIDDGYDIGYVHLVVFIHIFMILTSDRLMWKVW